MKILLQIFIKLVDQEDKGAFNIQPPVEKVDFPKVTGRDWSMRGIRFMALTYKRFHHFRRSKVLLFCATLLPALFTVLTLCITSSVPKLFQPVENLLDVSSCGACSIFYQTNSSSDWISLYTKQMTQPFGISAYPNLTSQDSHSKLYCKESSHRGKINISKVDYMSDCSCGGGRLHCTSSGDYTIMQCFNVSEGVSIVNATGVEMTNWILDTWKHFGNYRTGGYTLSTKYWSNNSLEDQHIFTRTRHSYLQNSSIDTIKILYALTTLACISVYFAFYVEAYVAYGNLLYMFLLFFLYGWACIPLMYLGSFLFNVPSSAFVILSSINIFIGISTSASVYVLRLFNDEDLSNIEYILRDVFLIFPHFCLGEGMIKMAEIYLVSAVLKTYGSDVLINKFSWQYLGKNYFSMFLTGCLLFGLVLLVDNFKGKKIFKEHLISMEELPAGEEDVEEEKRRVLDNSGSDILVLKYLTKMYKKEKNIAVNQLCLGVRRGECFGLLGVNGAGKSTTFNMLTGKTSITFGDALIDGHSVRHSMDQVKSKIGYCPQFDALDPLLTCKEHLVFYTMLRGVTKPSVPAVVNQGLNCFDLLKMSDTAAKYLSGGYRRKLSTAIALLGNPPIVFMDEPTCGMDVKGRRFLWERLKDRVKNGATLMLTSHALVECEALCSRLTVMVKGKFTCLGSVQHLKNKYGKGYTLMVRASHENLDQTRSIISGEIPAASEVCCYSEQIKYSLQLSLPHLVTVFKTLERLKSQDIIYNYSVSQNSLEQVCSIGDIFK